MKRVARNFIFTAVLGLWAHAVSANDVGTIHFPTTTVSVEAQAHFLRGATILHSFV